MLATCATCGQPVTPTAAVCGFCGRPTWGACPTCGGPVRAGAQWCGSCGSEVLALAVAPSGATTPLPPAQPTPMSSTFWAAPGPPSSWAPAAGPPPAVGSWLPGASVPSGTPVAALASAPRRRGGTVAAVLIAVVAVVVVVVVAVGGFVLLRPGRTATAPVFDGSEDPLALALPEAPAGSLPPINETTPATGHLTIGAETPLATQAIGAAGGTIAAQGLQIQIADGTLAADTTFEVKQAPITASTFGGFVTPITPLYLIDDGGATFDKPVTVVLPATIPAGKTAMAFSYDDVSGMLTPLMPIAQDATTLTVAATHFSPILGGLVDVTDESAPVDSGFRPGTDDWQFKNLGSLLNPSGICEGMNLSSIWYYINERRGADAPPLHGPSDNNGASPATPGFGMDDSNAYRFAASVHASPIGSWDMYAYLFNFAGIGDGRANYEAVKAAIRATGQPQLMAIDTDARNAAHSVIVVEVEANQLLVADPNYPGPKDNPRWIPYDPATGKLGPYSSGKSSADIAAHGVRIYTRFAYVPRATAAADAVIATNWADFQNKTAGNTAFPKYTLEALAGKDAGDQDVWVPLVDGYRTSDEKLTVRVSHPGGGSNNNNVMTKIYRGTSDTPATPGGRRVTLDLADGDNPLGILEEGRRDNHAAWGYANFVRLTVVRGPLATPTPPVAAGGHWVLISTTPNGGPNASSFSKDDEKLTVESSNGQIAVSYNYDGPPHRHETGSVSWGPPPASAAPGDIWTTTLSAQGSCSGDIDESWAIGVSAVILWTGHSDINHTVAATCQKGSQSAETSLAFPAVHEGGFDDSIEIDVSGGEPHGGDYWTYKYEWRP
jgi:hypothetical protein